MSVTKIEEGLYKVCWREEGRARSVLVQGSASLTDKVERKKLSLRDENRHLDVEKTINYRMDDLIDRYWDQYGIKKKSWYGEVPRRIENVSYMCIELKQAISGCG